LNNKELEAKQERIKSAAAALLKDKDKNLIHK
jgi:hypothetical protein